MLVVLDPAHGGNSPAGKSTSYGGRDSDGVDAKDGLLSACRGAARSLSGVRLTRDRDVNLSIAQRIEQARGADAFVSVHYGRGRTGVWVHPEATAEDERLAGSFAEELGVHIDVGLLAALDPRYRGPRTAACLIEVDDLHSPGCPRRRRMGIQSRRIVRSLARYGASGAARSTRNFLAVFSLPANKKILKIEQEDGWEDNAWLAAAAVIIDDAGRAGDDQKALQKVTMGPESGVSCELAQGGLVLCKGLRYGKEDAHLTFVSSNHRARYFHLTIPGSRPRHAYFELFRQESTTGKTVIKLIAHPTKQSWSVADGKVFKPRDHDQKLAMEVKSDITRLVQTIFEANYELDV